MTLDTYLASGGAKTLTQISVEVGISPSRLSQLRRDCDWPPLLALKVEAATGGRVDAATISPIVAMARAGNGLTGDHAAGDTAQPTSAATGQIGGMSGHVILDDPRADAGGGLA